MKELRDHLVRVDLGLALQNGILDRKPSNPRFCAKHLTINLGTLRSPQELGYLNDIFASVHCPLCYFVRSILWNRLGTSLQEPGTWVSCAVCPVPSHFDVKNGLVEFPDMVSTSLPQDLQVVLRGDYLEFHKTQPALRELRMHQLAKPKNPPTPL
ncbi:hypothetical protein EV356DRAFT_496927 [Viridothelium virens]|uniref:Uncharacterized protein n=1 Tax=Viridothelium virens TaxID=1048519 RepID=A0A6A6GTQ7_VIRVR|nr:hypothetical protein EV356DRAFT_496927 [Viridothelium virens]